MLKDGCNVHFFFMYFNVWMLYGSCVLITKENCNKIKKISRSIKYHKLFAKTITENKESIQLENMTE